jgi:anti-sigma B factor antagonist
MKTVNEFEIKWDENKVNVVFAGDLTASIVPELKSSVQKALDGGALEVEYDLSKATVIDSTGIGILIATYNSLMKKNGTVRLVVGSDDIFRMLQSMRLEKRLCVSKR